MFLFFLGQNRWHPMAHRGFCYSSVCNWSWERQKLAFWLTVSPSKSFQNDILIVRLGNHVKVTRRSLERQSLKEHAWFVEQSNQVSRQCYRKHFGFSPTNKNRRLRVMWTHSIYNKREIVESKPPNAVSDGIPRQCVFAIFLPLCLSVKLEWNCVFHSWILEIPFETLFGQLEHLTPSSSVWSEKLSSRLVRSCHQYLACLARSGQLLRKKHIEKDA